MIAQKHVDYRMREVALERERKFETGADSKLTFVALYGIYCGALDVTKEAAPLLRKNGRVSIDELSREIKTGHLRAEFMVPDAPCNTEFYIEVADSNGVLNLTSDIAFEIAQDCELNLPCPEIKLDASNMKEMEEHLRLAIANLREKIRTDSYDMPKDTTDNDNRMGGLIVSSIRYAHGKETVDVTKAALPILRKTGQVDFKDLGIETMKNDREMRFSASWKTKKGGVEGDSRSPLGKPLRLAEMAQVCWQIYYLNQMLNQISPPKYN